MRPNKPKLSKKFKRQSPLFEATERMGVS